MIALLLIPFVVLLFLGAYNVAIYKWILICAIVICLLTGAGEYDN